MINLTYANFERLKKSSALGLYLIAMLILASAFMIMQVTAMDYTVPLSRVVFLPLTFYGVATATFISVFAGTDFSDGFIRNKLLLANSRNEIVISHLLVSCIACVFIYIVTTLYTLGIGSFFFENDIASDIFIQYFLLGISMSVALGCFFNVITLLCSKKTSAIIWCMGISFGMLFLSLHTNQLLVQPEYKNNIPNPHYIDGFQRILYGILHDLNPYGQIAQLTSWKIWNPMRAALCNLFWITGTTVIGCILFHKKDIK